MPLKTTPDPLAPTLPLAADNATDIPRSTADTAMTGEVITGTGDAMSAEIETKRLHIGPDNPSSKGHDRAYKHGHKKQGLIDAQSGHEGAEVDPIPGEDEDQDVLRGRRDGVQ
ncbi:hypothetical protein EJ06DRAFT_533865 [Trichodelitschia bisporula]|uniref:Uncharacterized protein n=1 Tax=Trichodelitschia bisporula TaxID=703511 RepID=A0A6G1HKK5_9PEZI|nr:hypothetical protein EJ06DRAFT_533865 [Trichodelitschia bisporula]